MPEDLKEDLKVILNKRNYLVHKYFKLEIQKVYSELGRKEMLRYFCDFIDDSKEIDDKLNSYYSNYTERLGITDDRIAQLMEEMKKEEIEREEQLTKNKAH